METLQEKIHIAFQFIKVAQPDIFNKSQDYQIQQINHYFNLSVSIQDLDLYFQPTLEESIEDLRYSIGDYYE